MSDPSPAHDERLALCDLLDEVGGGAPTLSGDWTTADLAAHLVVRERDPIGASGIVVPQMAGYTERAMRKVTERLGYEGLVEQIRRGPPVGPFRWFEDQLNLNEFFVHHEDVRRGDDSSTPRPSASTADLDEALWANLARAAKLMTRTLRKLPLVLEWPGRGAITVRRGAPYVTIMGPPGEITLYLNGRRAPAQVDLAGPTEKIEQLQAAPLGI